MVSKKKVHQYKSGQKLRYLSPRINLRYENLRRRSERERKEEKEIDGDKEIDRDKEIDGDKEKDRDKEIDREQLFILLCHNFTVILWQPSLPPFPLLSLSITHRIQFYLICIS